jgi:hypothetical protein
MIEGPGTAAGTAAAGAGTGASGTLAPGALGKPKGGRGGGRGAFASGRLVLLATGRTPGLLDGCNTRPSLSDASHMLPLQQHRTFPADLTPRAAPRPYDSNASARYRGDSRLIRLTTIVFEGGPI